MARGGKALDVPPQATLRIGSCDVLLLGTLAGFVPDGARVEEACSSFRPDTIALGVPPEDIEALRVLHVAADPQALLSPNEAPPAKGKARIVETAGGTPAAESLLEPPSGPPVPEGPDSELPFAGLDAPAARLLQLLANYGPTRLPSPDLERAFAASERQAVRLVPLDLDDVQHSNLVTRSLGITGLFGRSRADRRALELPFEEADAYQLAKRFDAVRNGTRGLRRIEVAREEHMARCLVEAATHSNRLLAVVPWPRMAGIMARLPSASAAASPKP